MHVGHQNVPGITVRSWWESAGPRPTGGVLSSFECISIKKCRIPTGVHTNTQIVHVSLHNVLQHCRLLFSEGLLGKLPFCHVLEHTHSVRKRVKQSKLPRFQYCQIQCDGLRLQRAADGYVPSKWKLRDSFSSDLGQGLHIPPEFRPW